MKISRFIYKYRFVMLSLIFAAVIMVIIAAVFSIDNSTNRLIINYVESFGWRLEPSPIEISHITIPEEFDAVYEAYNTVQQASGLKFEDFKGKKATRYTYRVLNHQDSGKVTVVASVFVYENTIIAADISSGDSNGFMHTITDTSKIAD